MKRFISAFLLLIPLLTAIIPSRADNLPTSEDVLFELQRYFKKCAKDDGSFQPGIDPRYEGMSDSAFSDLAPTAYAVVIHKTFGWKLPDEATTRNFLLSRQRDDGAFVNVAGTVDPGSSAGRAYNTTIALMALRALDTKPKHDPLPVFDAVLKADYKELPLYMTSFFPLAYHLCDKPIPEEADRKIKGIMVQDDDGYISDHVAATFHAAHYYRLIKQDVPKDGAMLKRVLRDQRKDGSWVINPTARDRHATFDACFIIKQLGGGNEEARKALARAAKWSLSCRNADGGFGHVPGSTSDADACYFHIGTLVMAGWLKPDEPLPKNAHLLGWGHLLPAPEAR